VSTPALPERGRLLGVDPGKVRIGLAITDPDRKLAFPLSVHERRGPERDAAVFQKLVKDEQIVQIVVGLPVHLDGREGTSAQEARTFGTWLSAATQLPVVYFDERFTTAQAERLLWDAGLSHKDRKARRDKLAAQILLQAYLEAGCPASPEARPLDE
jgi:putative holliday junction resolvase